MQLNKCAVKSKIYESKIRKLISAVFPGSKGEKFVTRLRNCENFLIQLINYSKIILKINVLTVDLQTFDP